MSKPARRRFLATLGLGGAGVAVAALSGQRHTTAAAEGPPLAADPKHSKGYRLTAHVRNYYRTARV
jgi:hypothetical protein